MSATVYDNYIPNGQYVGNSRISNEVRSAGFDPYLRRPFFDRNGDAAVMVNLGKTTLVKGEQVPIHNHVRISDLERYRIPRLPVHNATMLRKEQWIELDKVVLKAARFRLRAWADLSASSTFGGFNGMAKTILEHENMSDPGEAIQSMSGLATGRNDAPVFGGQGLPLPITHCDFWFDQRTLSSSRLSDTPLDMTMGEAAARRVGELVEGTTIGTRTGMVYGGANTALTYTNTPAVYGYTNFPQRLTRTTIRRPDVSTWTPAQTLADVLAMRDQLTANKFYGPFMLYHSNDWDQYMDADYITTIGATTSTMTLRRRLLNIGMEDNGAGGAQAQISGVRRLDLLFGTALTSNEAESTYRGPGTQVDVTLKPFTLIMVQMTPDVARAVDGLGLTTLQWETIGGMMQNFKVMCIWVPQLRADKYGNCGILHATIN